MGLLNMLEKLLETISGVHEVKTWNIYQEKNGTTVVKISFNSYDIINIEKASYKKKSQKQVQRDHTRATNHVRNIKTSSMSHRSDNMDIENVRECESISNLHVISPTSSLQVEKTPDLYVHSPLLPDYSHTPVTTNVNRPIQNQLIENSFSEICDTVDAILPSLEVDLPSVDL